MAYRKYNRRRSRRGRSFRKTHKREESPIEALAELIADGIVGSFRLLRRGVVWLWRRPMKSQPRVTPQSSPGAPHVPFPRSPPLPPSLRAPIPERLPDRQRAGDRPGKVLPYVRKESLLEKGEHALAYPLREAIGNKYQLFYKVRLADIICCPPERIDEGHWFRKIGNYHVDFVVCELGTATPLLVIELDGHQHQRRRQQERDQFKDESLRAAGLPIYRIPAQRAYDSIELAETIDRLIGR